MDVQAAIAFLSFFSQLLKQVSGWELNSIDTRLISQLTEFQKTSPEHMIGPNTFTEKVYVALGQANQNLNCLLARTHHQEGKLVIKLFLGVVEYVSRAIRSSLNTPNQR